MTIGIISLLVAFLALIVAFYQSSLARRQRVRDFEMIYVQRYWSVIDRIRSPRSGGSIPMPCEQERPDIELYLELCEDEVDVRRLGLVSDSTWEIWSDAIVGALHREPYATVWRELSESTPERFKNLHEIQRQIRIGALCDPCATPRWRRMLRGLTSPG